MIQKYKVNKCSWKSGADRFVQCRIATHLQFVKNEMSEEHHKANAIKGGTPVCQKPIANILIGKRLRSFPLRSKTREGGLLLPLLFNIVLKVLARTCRQKNNKKASKLDSQKVEERGREELFNGYSI